MHDFWITQTFLKGVAIGYIALVLIAIALALWLPKRWPLKLIAVAVVLGLASLLPRQAQKEQAQQQNLVDEHKAKLAKAQALFEERCKTAGEKIYKTVDNVEGVLLMKMRPDRINQSDQYAMDDPFGADCHGQSCIAELLRVSQGSELNPELAKSVANKFEWVEVIENKKRIRYVGSIREVTHTDSILLGGDGKTTFRTKDFVLDQVRTPIATPRYGVTWDDLSTREDRDFWIAGGSLKVIDLTTQKIIAERVGFMMDRGQGNMRGERSPWAFAYDNACPKLPLTAGGRALRVGRTKKFVFNVLHPTKGR